MSVKVGIISVGLAGSMRVKILTEPVGNAGVVALIDIDLERCQQLADTTPSDVQMFGCADYLVSDPTVEAVVVASIAQTHADLVLKCTAAGKPVFCEKRLAITEADCSMILEAETAAGRKFVQVRFMRRLDPGYLQLKSDVDRRDVGIPVGVHGVHRNVSVPYTFTSQMTASEGNPRLKGHVPRHANRA